jgi:hypothetical protein
MFCFSCSVNFTEKSLAYSSHKKTWLQQQNGPLAQGGQALPEMGKFGDSDGFCGEDINSPALR